MAKYLIQEDTLNNYAEQVQRLKNTVTKLTPQEQIDFLATIARRSDSNLTVSGPKVTVPSGYYPAETSKTVATATRAATSLEGTADAANAKITYKASNNQETGYVTGANKTATKTVTLTASGKTVTASDGTNSVSKSVSTGSATTPSTSIVASPSIFVDANGKITAAYESSKEIKPTVVTGWVSEGTPGVISLSGRTTSQMETVGATTITPGTTQKTAVAKGKYTTGTVSVAGDSNLVPSNIKAGCSIFGVTGVFSGSSGSDFDYVRSFTLSVGETLTVTSLTGSTEVYLGDNPEGDPVVSASVGVNGRVILQGQNPGSEYIRGFYPPGGNDDHGSFFKFYITVTEPSTEEDLLDYPVTSWEYPYETGASSSGGYLNVTSWEADGDW